jgi:26S proteasome regulatory subunit N2
VYYHLQEYDESMTFALGAGDLFKLDHEGEFEETIISKCVDTYITVSAANHTRYQDAAQTGILPTLATSFANGTADSNAAAALTSPTTPFSQSALPSKSLLSRENTLSEQTVNEGKLKPGSSTLPDRATQTKLQLVIERLFESCLNDGRYRQVVGIAVEAKNLDVLRMVIQRASIDEKKSRGKQAEGASEPIDELMEYVLDICMGVVQERGFRTEILRLILNLLNEIPTPDYFSIAKCVVYLNQDEEASTMLKKLVVCLSISKTYKTAY